MNFQPHEMIRIWQFAWLKKSYTQFFTINFFIMKRILLLSLYLMISWHTASATTYTLTGGNWESAGAWQGGVVPPNPLPAADNIVINCDCFLSSSRTFSGTLTINQPYKLTIQSGGSLTVDGMMTTNGVGSLWVTAGASLTVNTGKTYAPNDGAVTIFSGATFNNNGTFTIPTFAAFNMNGTCTNTGTITSNTIGTIIGNGGVLNNIGIINNNQEFIVHGDLNLQPGSTFNNNGTLLGGGVITGDLTNPPGGTVFVFGYGNNCLDFNGNFVNQGLIKFYYVGDVPCSSHTKLNVNGSMTLGGILELNIYYPPVPGMVYTFIDATSITGTFSNIMYTTINTFTFPNGMVVEYNNPNPGEVTMYYAGAKTITASAGTGGSISPSGAVSVNQGANQSFTITPAMGYCIQGVMVDGSDAGPVASYTFTNVTADHTISATFAAAGAWYLDADGDGYYGSTQNACTSPGMGWTSTLPSGGSGDCDDNDPVVYPNATDVCDGKDNDCDGTVDEGGNGTPTGWAAGNVGGAMNANSQFSCGTGGTVFTITSQGFSGSLINDVLNSNYQQKCGNASITAHITGNPAPGWAGIFIREDLTAGSKVVSLKTNLTNFVRREVRSTTNGNKMTQQSPIPASHTWVRMVRTGNVFSYYTSPNGTAWSLVGSVNVAMNNCVYLGLFVESTGGATPTSASFDNVTITGGAAPLAAMPNLDFEVQEEQHALSFTLYPNPTTGVLFLQLATKTTDDQPLQVRVFNALGVQVEAMQIKAPAGIIALNQLSDLPNGMYWIQMQTPGFAPQMQQVVLQH